MVEHIEVFVLGCANALAATAIVYEVVVGRAPLWCLIPATICAFQAVAFAARLGCMLALAFIQDTSGEGR